MMTIRGGLLLILIGLVATPLATADDVDRLVEYLGNSDKDLRIAAIEQLADLKGEAAKKAIPHLVEAMNDAESGLAAAKALKKLGALDELKAARDTGQEPARKFAAVALGDEPEPAAATGTAGRKPVPRPEDVPAETRRIVEQLVERLDDQDDLVRAEALEQLSKVGMAAKAVAPGVGTKIVPIYKNLPPGQGHTRRLYLAAQRALIALDCVEELNAALRDNTNYLPHNIMMMLGQIGPGAKSSLADIRIYAKHPKPLFRQSARCAIALIDDSNPAAVLDLIPLLKDEEVLRNDGALVIVLDTIRIMGPRAKATTPAVAAILNPDQPQTDRPRFIMACKALNAIHTSEALQALQRAKAAVDERFRENLLGSPNQADLDFSNWYVIEVLKAPGTAGTQRQGSPYATGP